MDFLIDTHVLVWVIEGNRRLTAAARSAIEDQDNRLFVSAVSAWEFADLRRRGRLPTEAGFGYVRDLLSLRLLDLPADLWTLVERLEDFNRDPVDRMVIAQAIHGGYTLITADAAMRRYPVASLW